MGSFGDDCEESFVHPLGSLEDSKKQFHLVHHSDHSPSNRVIHKQSLPTSPCTVCSRLKPKKQSSATKQGANAYQFNMSSSIVEQDNEDENLDFGPKKIRLSDVPEESEGVSQLGSNA